MSVNFINAGTAGLRGATDLTTLSYPFTIVCHVKYVNTLGWQVLSLFGLEDTGRSNDCVTADITPEQFKTRIGNVFGVTTSTGTNGYATPTDVLNAGWIPCYLEVTDTNNAKLFWNGSEQTYSLGTNRDIFGSFKLGQHLPFVGQGSRNSVKMAHYALFNRALTSSEKSLVSTNTPDNLGGALPLVYQRLDTNSNDGIGNAWAEINAGDAVWDGVDNPSLVAPSPVNPVFTGGPTAVAIGETIVTAQGTSDLDCNAQVVVVSSGAGQPSDATFDSSSFSSFVTGGVQFNIPITGLTGLTNYDLWVRLKPNIGTSSYGDDAFSTTPAAPTITNVNGGNPILKGSTYIVTGSGFTGHTAADIDGTSQTGFTVDSDTQVTITTAVRPNSLRYTDNALFNIGGTTSTVTMLPESGWDYVDIASVSTSGIIITSPAISVGDQVEWDVQGAANIQILNDASVSMDTFTASTSGEVHDGVSWGGAGTFNFQLTSSTTPDPFTFTDVSSAELSTLTESNTITVSGITQAVPISISGSSGEYAVDTGSGFGAYTSASSTVNNGDDVKVRLTSSASYNTESFTTLDINGVSDAFNVTTRIADTTPDAFTFTSETNAEVSTQYESNTITVTGVDAGINIPISITGGEYSVNGGAYTSTAGNVLLNSTVQVRRTSSSSYSTTVGVSLDIGGFVAPYNIETRAADITPDTFTFTPVSGAEPSVYIESNTITVTGVDAGVNIPVSISGETNSQYSINGGSWVSSAGNVQLNDTVQVRVITSQYNNAILATLDINGVTGTFNVTTRAADTTPDTFTFTPVTGSEVNTVRASNTIVVTGIDSGINVPVSISGSGSEYSINGGSWVNTAGILSLNDTVQVRLISSTSYNTQVTATLDISGVTGDFNVTTRVADTTPDAFIFTAQNNVPLSTLVTSNTITVTGVDSGVNIPISVVGGEYSVNGGMYDSSPGNVQLNDLITVRHTSSSSGSTLTTTTLDIGGVTGDFTSSTIAVVSATLTDTLVIDNNDTPYITANIDYWVLDGSTNSVVDSGTVNPSTSGVIVISDTSIVAGTSYMLVLQSQDNTRLAVKEITAV